MNHNYIILTNSVGDNTFKAQKATIANAMELFQNTENFEMLDSKIFEYAYNDTHRLSSPTRLIAAIRDIATLSLGAPSAGLKSLAYGINAAKSEVDSRPQVLVSMANKVEVSVWMKKNNLQVDNLLSLNGDDIVRLGADKLEFLSSYYARLGKPALFILNDSYFDIVATYRNIVNNRVHPKAPQHIIVAIIIEFITKYMPRSDVKYQVLLLNN